MIHERPSSGNESQSNMASTEGDTTSAPGKATAETFPPQSSQNVLDEHFAYWQQHLADLPLLTLPTDRPRQPQTPYRQERVSFALSAETPMMLTTLTRVSLRENATLFTTLLTGWQVLLSRYSGQEDIPVGISGLNGVEMLALRTDLSGGPTLSEALQRVSAGIQEAYTHSDWSFDLVARSLRLEDAGTTHSTTETSAAQATASPIVQVRFALHHSDEYQQFVAGTQTTEAFDLDVALSLSEDGLVGTVAFDANLFDRSTIERLIGHYRVVLEVMCVDMMHQCQRIPLLTAWDRHQILVKWNETATDYPRNSCVYHLFEAQVERTPLAIAVKDEQGKLTYRELNERANRMARHLRTMGVGAETFVGISVERGAQMLVSLLAIQKAGGTYVPLDPGFPPDRLAYMAENAQIPVLVTQEHLRAQLPVPEHVQILCIDDSENAAQQFARYSSENLHIATAPEQLAYVLYTSGSTGKPKGVQIPHRALTNFLCSMQKEPGLRAGDTLLAVTTLSFDIAELELYLPLLVGGRVFIASRDTAISGAALARTMEREGITVLQATPITWRLLLNSGWQGKADLTALCGGEAMPRDLAAQLIPRTRALYNLYGPTETTVWSTVCLLQSVEGTISIGRPIANTDVYVLDAFMQPVPIGVAGELYIGGDGVARGYLHRPELTRERFIPNPFVTTPNSLIYRTGDLARYLPDGSLEHLGRLDHQVKIRGFRIELGEIEAVLHQHATVKDGVVMAREDVHGDKRLVAYVVPTKEQRQVANDGEIIADIRALLRQKLPEYMMPTVFVLLDALPQTPNGKVNRQALPAPSASDHKAADAESETMGEPSSASGTRPALATNYAAPRDEAEQRVARVWQQSLGIEPMGIFDRFDELGGDSLQAFQVITCLYDAFQIQLSIKEFPASSTVASITATLNQKLATLVEQIDADELAALLADIEHDEEGGDA